MKHYTELFFFDLSTLQAERIKQQQDEQARLQAQMQLKNQQASMVRMKRHRQEEQRRLKAQVEAQQAAQLSAAAGIYQATQPFQGTPQQQEVAYQAWLQEYQRQQDLDKKEAQGSL